MDASVQLINVLASRHLVQAVDVLRDNGEQFALFFPLRQLPMDDIGLCIRIKHAISIEIKENLRMMHVERVRNDGFRRVSIPLTIQPILPAEIRNAAFGRHARAAEEHHAPGLFHPALQFFQLLFVHSLTRFLPAGN